MTASRGPVPVARRVLMAALVAFVALVVVTALAIQLAPVVGHRLFAIRSGSMQPELGVGDLVVVRETDAAAVDDILTYRLPNGVVVTHRVTEVAVDGAVTTYRTKGDANPAVDAAPVPAGWSIGIVAARIPLLGFGVALIAMPIGLVSVLSIAASLMTAIWLLDEYATDAGQGRGQPSWPADPKSSPAP